MRERDKLINREKQRQDVLSRRAGRPPDSPKADDQHDLPGILEEEEGGWSETRPGQRAALSVSSPRDGAVALSRLTDEGRRGLAGSSGGASSRLFLPR